MKYYIVSNKKNTHCESFTEKEIKSLTTKVTLESINGSELKEFNMSDCVKIEYTGFDDKNGKMIFEGYSCDYEDKTITIKKINEEFKAVYFNGNDFINFPLNKINNKLTIKKFKILERAKPQG